MAKKQKITKHEAVEAINAVIETALAKNTPAERAQKDEQFNIFISNCITRNDLIGAIQSIQGTSTLETFAKDIGCTKSYLSEVYKGTRELGPETLKSLGLKRETTYRRWR